MGRDLFRRRPGHSKKLDCWMRAGDLFRRTPVHPKKLDPWIRAPLRASVMRGAELCLVGIEQGRPHLSQKRGRGRWISIGEDDDGGPIVREGHRLHVHARRAAIVAEPPVALESRRS